MLLFVAYLAKERLSYTTIKVYLAAIRNLHTTARMHHTYQEQLTPYLEQVLQGIKKQQLTHAPTRERLPITVDIMANIWAVLSHSPKDYHCIMMWAACYLAFFSFLRCGEFTVPNQSEFDVNTHLSVTDIAVDSKTSPSVIQVAIKQSKTDPFRKGIQLFLGRIDHHICPVKGILPYLALQGTKPGPLFITQDNKFLTRQLFSAALSKVLKATGHDSCKYNTYSFRIGAAMTGKQAGISDVHIKMLGRWQSSTYQQYIRTPQQQLASLSAQLVSTHKT